MTLAIYASESVDGSTPSMLPNQLSRLSLKVAGDSVAKISASTAMLAPGHSGSPTMPTDNLSHFEC